MGEPKRELDLVGVLKCDACAKEFLPTPRHPTDGSRGASDIRKPRGIKTIDSRKTTVQHKNNKQDKQYYVFIFYSSFPNLLLFHFTQTATLNSILTSLLHCLFPCFLQVPQKKKKTSPFCLTINKESDACAERRRFSPVLMLEVDPHKEPRLLLQNHLVHYLIHHTALHSVLLYANSLLQLSFRSENPFHKSKGEK